MKIYFAVRKIAAYFGSRFIYNLIPNYYVSQQSYPNWKCG